MRGESLPLHFFQTYSSRFYAILMTDPEFDDSKEILIVGNFTWDRLAASYKRTFEVLGHRVYSVHTTERDDDLSPWLSNRIGKYATRNQLWLRRRGSRSWNQTIQAAADTHDPDFVLLFNGSYVMPETIEGLRGQGYPVYVFHADRPFPSSPNFRPEYLPAAEACTAYFIWSRALQQRLQNRGVDTHYLPFGWDPFVFPNQDSPGEAEHEVVFIGGWDERRERWLTPVAESFDLKIWGPDYWGTRTSWGSPLRDCWQGEALRGEQAAEVLAESKIALNVLRHQNLPDGTNMRTFEVPGCGGFLLATRTEGATEIFPEGQAGAYFGTVDEMMEKIRYYLDADEERQSIAKQAHRHVSDSHRYRRRAHRILQVHGETVPSGEPV